MLKQRSVFSARQFKRECKNKYPMNCSVVHFRPWINTHWRWLRCSQNISWVNGFSFDTHIAHTTIVLCRSVVGICSSSVRFRSLDTLFSKGKSSLMSEFPIQVTQITLNSIRTFCFGCQTVVPEFVIIDLIPARITTPYFIMFSGWSTNSRMLMSRESTQVQISSWSINLSVTCRIRSHPVGFSPVNIPLWWCLCFFPKASILEWYM